MSFLARMVVLASLPLYPLVAVSLAVLNVIPSVSAPGRFNYFGWAIAHGLGLVAFVLAFILLQGEAKAEIGAVLPRVPSILIAYLAGLVVAAITTWVVVGKHWSRKRDAG